MLKTHFYGMKIAFFTLAAYRMDFFVGLLVILAGTLLSPLLLILIYNNGASIGGYDIYQVFLIQGVYLTASGFGSVFFFDIVYSTTYRVREGTFDILLLKPHSLLSILIATSYSNSGFANIFGGLILFVYAVVHMPHISALQWLLFWFLFLTALLLMFAFSVILAALGIVWVGNSRLLNIYYSIAKFSEYPVTIFQKALRTILSYLIPVAMLGFFPASVLMGLPVPYLYVSVISSFVFAGIAMLFFKMMLRKYTSTGG